MAVSSYTFARFLGGFAPLLGDFVVEFSDDDADDEMFWSLFPRNILQAERCVSFFHEQEWSIHNSLQDPKIYKFTVTRVP